jgi:hypothetical protein
LDTISEDEIIASDDSINFIHLMVKEEEEKCASSSESGTGRFETHRGNQITSLLSLPDLFRVGRPNSTHSANQEASQL